MALTKQQALKLPLLEFGQIDARAEVSTRDKEKKKFFHDSFLLPRGIHIEEYFNGDKCFIHGSKGCGKTAFLRYLQIEAQALNHETIFVLFSEDISEQERDQLLKLSDAIVVDKPNVSSETDVVNAWVLFFHKKISEKLSDGSLDSKDSLYQINEYSRLCRSVYDGKPEGVLSNILSLINKGVIRLRTKLSDGVEASGELELKNNNEVLIHVFIEKIAKLLKSIKISDEKKLYIFVDELNLSMTSRKQHRRDSILIRDLVIAVGKLNRMFVENDLPIVIVAAIRNEVLASVNVSKNEVYKYLFDAGKEIEWFGRAKYDRYPILEMIEKKIQTSEMRHLLDKTDDEEIWEKYFSNQLYGIGVKQFIIEVTWCNPRDIVLLMGTICKNQYNVEKINMESIKGVIEEYSAMVWRERTEDLSVDYAPAEISAIKRIINGWNRYFKADQFQKIAESKAESDSAIMQFTKNRDMTRVLEDLYWCGVLGLSYRQHGRRGRDERRSASSYAENWVYRGDMDFDATAWSVVHRALWPELNLGQYSANGFALGERFAGAD